MNSRHVKHPLNYDVSKKNQKGFTLIELVIVIAVIGILAAFIAPRGGQVFQDAQLVSVSEAVNALKTATAQYVVANKTLPITEGQLIQQKFLDGLATSTVAVGTGTTFTNVAGNLAGELSAGNGFDLDGDGVVDTTAGEKVIQISIAGVTDTDARRISLALDGNVNTPAINVLDAKGRVEYPAIAAGATGTVVIYVDSL